MSQPVAALEIQAGILGTMRLEEEEMACYNFRAKGSTSLKEESSIKGRNLAGLQDQA